MKRSGRKDCEGKPYLWLVVTKEIHEMQEHLNVPSAEDILRLQECQERLATIKDEIAALQFPDAEKWHSSDINVLAIQMRSLAGQLESASPNQRPIRAAEALLLLATCAYFSDPPGLTDADRQAMSQGKV